MRKNMQRWSISLGTASLLLAGCAQTPPATTRTQTETEIARLERHLVAAPPAETPSVPERPVAPIATVTTLVSRDFKEATVKAVSALASLARAMDTEAAFDAAFVEARAQVLTARSTVRNEHDRNAAIVLTALLLKQRQLAFLNLLIRRNPTIEPDAKLAAEKEACSSELRAWLQGSSADVPRLQRAPCLASARAAFAVLSQ